jgi:hypothetical protein
MAFRWSAFDGLTKPLIRPRVAEALAEDQRPRSSRGPAGTSLDRTY